ncbi:thioredoxin family protein [Mesoterricola sediminis]|uniref:Thioredoxin domain-containing protein n=1 Tax=Mesoterricola sediminis TaxID=2927980 RepID=A0AA48HGT1_9BACT|nr:thioredoxin family protein [Mesoterricola sediminis]BDU77943.1 hypothetical protein METESE_29010 [Mesoterricola sediminis]
MRAFLVTALLAATLPGLAAPPDAKAPQTGPYDPARDSFKDLEAAKAEAARSGRRILLIVGGNWCPWCHRLHGLFAADAELAGLRDRAFVTVPVDFSKAHRNEAFLAQFPKVPGYPHLFVLDAAGKLLHSQDTGVLEQDKGYDRAKIAAFIEAWKPKA